MRVTLTLQSRNIKTGPIPVSTTSRDTCPNACPLKNNGCYAEIGRLAIHWRKVSSGERGLTYRQFLASIKSLPEGQLWRHNQAGDLPGKGNDIDVFALADLVNANKGRRGFTYTHKPMTKAANRKAIASANRNGFTINLSADTLVMADELADLGVAPVAVILPSNTGDVNTVTPKGRTVVVCPATYRKDITCMSCKLCQKADRKTIVGFPAHGTIKKKVDVVCEH